MGKIILLVLVCFAIYWSVQAYRNGQKKKEEKETPKDYPDYMEGNVEQLKKFYENKIAELENKSLEGLDKAQQQLKHYKEELEKINQLKK